MIVLTQSYWQAQFQGSPAALGKEVRIDDEAYTVISVAPLLASYLPARRASRIDPLVALRDE